VLCSADEEVRTLSDPDEARDDEFIDELRGLTARFDPTPAWVTQAAREAYTWRTIDAELAALTYDSALEDAATSGVRGVATGEVLSFETAEVTVDVEVSPAPRNRRRLVAQLAPAQAAQVEVRHREGTTSATADPLGRFVVDGLPTGPMSLRCRLASGGELATEWTTL